MKHLAVRSLSVHCEGRPYTTPGLGDRIHTATLGWAWGPPVTLHLTADKLSGGQFANKPASWAEIVSLFPAGSLVLRPHPVAGLPEDEWVEYLRRQGYPAKTYWYGDFPGRCEGRGEVDMAKCLRSFPLLTAAPQPIELPERFVTLQADSNGPGRAMPPEVEARVRERWPVVVVGGAATGDLRWSLSHIAYALSRAEAHVGVDSAFLHLAQLYLPPERIHLWARSLSHHARRAVVRGVHLL